MVRLISWASGIIKDTTGVSLEGRVGKETNDMRSVGGNGFGKGVDSGFVGVDEVVAGNAGFHHAVGVRASSILSSVWVVFFLADTTVINDEIEGVFWVSTIETSIIRTAVNQHLFRKNNLTISSDVPGGFNGSNDSESPTASTLSLVLDRVHDGSPVSGIGSGGLFQVGFSNVSLTESQFRLGLQQKLVLEFFPGPIRVEVDSLSVSGQSQIEFSIVLFNFFQVVQENLFPISFINHASEAFLELKLEFFPSLVMRQRGRSHSKKCQSDDE